MKFELMELCRCIIVTKYMQAGICFMSVVIVIKKTSYLLYLALVNQIHFAKIVLFVSQISFLCNSILYIIVKANCINTS